MNDLPSQLPRPEASMRNPWIAWIIACTLLPASPLILFGGSGEFSPDFQGFFPRFRNDYYTMFAAALLCHVGCSIWLARAMSQKLRKSKAHAVLMFVVFLITGAIIGTVSFFASCIGLAGR